MAMFGKLIGLAKSPQGRRLLSQAQKAARDPQNRERLQEVRSRFRNGKTTPAQGAQAADPQRDQQAATGGEETAGSGSDGRAGGQSGEAAGRPSAGTVDTGIGEEESRLSGPA